MKKQQNYYWDITSPKRARKVYKEGTEIYKLFSDDTQALVESEHDLEDAIDLGIELGIKTPILQTKS